MSSESDRLQNSWIANAGAWCEAVREHRIESRRVVTNEAIVSAVIEQDPRRVLDVGCGEGWLCRELSRQGIVVTGVDASAPLIDAARALGGGSFLRMTYQEMTADPKSTGKDYDVIVANFALLDENVEDLLRALRELLSDAGRLIVQTVHPFSATEGSYADGWRVETFENVAGDWREPMPWYFRTIGSWFRLFSSAGYSIAGVREPMYPDHPVPASIIFVCINGRLAPERTPT